MSFTVKEVIEGLGEALELLRIAGPNPIYGEETVKEYWVRLETLRSKFEPEEEED